MDNNQCCVCFKDSQLSMSCSHTICVACVKQLVQTNNYNSCPTCGNFLLDDINKLYLEYMKDPTNSFYSNYGFKNNDTIWAYQGANGNYWAFTKYQCDIIESKYQKYIGDNVSAEFQLLVSTGNIYIINFHDMIQYASKNEQKMRDIIRFKMLQYQDIIDNKIIGVAGTKF